MVHIEAAYPSQLQSSSSPPSPEAQTKIDPSPFRPYNHQRNSIFSSNPSSYLVDSLDDGPHGGISRSVNRLAVVSWSPRGRVDVDLVRLVTHRVGLKSIICTRSINYSKNKTNLLQSDRSCRAGRAYGFRQLFHHKPLQLRRHRCLEHRRSHRRI